jgi:hypothetical protein
MPNPKRRMLCRSGDRVRRWLGNLVASVVSVSAWAARRRKVVEVAYWEYAGVMLSLRRKTLAGSTVALMRRSRARVVGG